MQNVTFSVTGFSNYSVEEGISSDITAPQDGQRFNYTTSTIPVAVSYTGAGSNCNATIDASGLSIVGSATNYLGNLQDGSSTQFVVNLTDGTNDYNRTYLINVTTVCSLSRSSDAVSIAVLHTWTLDNNFIDDTGLISGVPSYDAGDYVRYTLDVYRDSAPFNLTGGGNLKYNLTKADMTVLASQNIDGMRLVGQGKYYGKIYYTQAMKNQACQGYSYCPIRSDAYLYDPWGNLLGSSLHGDQYSGNSTSLSVTSTYPYSLDGPSENTIMNLTVYTSDTEVNWAGSELDLHTKNPLQVNNAVRLSQGFAYVNSTSFSELSSTPYEYENFKAQVKMSNVNCAVDHLYYGSGTTKTAIITSGVLCPSNVCLDQACTDGILTFNVTHFTGYAYGTDSNLTIWDDTDLGTKIQGENVEFYANYTDITGAEIEGASCKITLNASTNSMPWNATSRLYTYARTFGTSGVWGWNVTCNNTLGYDNLSATDTVTIQSDTTPPAIGWNWLQKNSTITTTSTIPCVILSKTGNCTLNWNGTLVPNWTYSTSICWTRTGLSNGNYSTIRATCEDLYSNVANSTKAWINVDTAAPTPTITSIGGGSSAPYVTTDNTPDVVVSLNENGGCYASTVADRSYDLMVTSGDTNCAGDGTTTSTCTLPTQSDGAHTVYVSCQDSYGNKNTAANNNQSAFTVDTTPPTITTNSATNTTITTITHTFNVTTSEAGNCSVYLDSEWFALSGSGTAHTLANSSMTQGNHTGIYYRCQDVAANKANSGTYWLKVDSIAPTITINSARNTTLTSALHIFNVTLSEAGNCSLYLNNTRYPSTVGTHITWTKTLSSGNYTVNYTCEDIYGNTNTTPTYWLDFQLCGNLVTDPGEDCDGETCCSDTCTFNSSGTLCRASNGVCDIAENCTGSNAACPPDLKSTAVCRPSTGPCDIAGVCDGSSDSCPPDTLRPATYVCRASTGPCDLVENCTGSTDSCPADQVASNVTVCRPLTDPCDLAEICDGQNKTCPADLYLPNGTNCSDGLSCTTGDYCVSGICTPLTDNCASTQCSKEWTCGDWSPCSGGTETRSCHCGCANDDDCSGDRTTTRSCGCATASDCPQQDCKVVSCTDNQCVYTNSQAGTSCDDNNACTENDYCSNGICTGNFICECKSVSDCDDGNPCTSESCVSGRCQYAQVTGPCSDNDDCTINDYCSNGICTGKNVCETCSQPWNCTAWGLCNSTQTRSCTCGCANLNCSGDDTTTQPCTMQLNLSARAEDLQVGQILRVNVTDEFGNPVVARIVLIRPDGSIIVLNGASATYVVDQSGVWKIEAFKAGYTSAESQTKVGEGPTWSKDIGTQISEAFQSVATFVAEPVTLAILLCVVAGASGVFLHRRKRGKGRHVKKL